MEVFIALYLITICGLCCFLISDIFDYILDNILPSHDISNKYKDTVLLEEHDYIQVLDGLPVTTHTPSGIPVGSVANYGPVNKE